MEKNVIGVQGVVSCFLSSKKMKKGKIETPKREWKSVERSLDLVRHTVVLASSRIMVKCLLMKR